MKTTTKNNLDHLETQLVSLLAIVTIVLVSYLGMALLKHIETLEDPSLFWCKTLRDSGSELSCDWEGDDLPRRALQYWHAGFSPEEATYKAAKDIEKAENQDREKQNKTAQ